ncbi:HNH endonuclease [Halococcus salsus]|uniref:HNH endonuclease n=1 Tax=Halococcus salsus TaxID=2162894 RepID=UPI00135935B5|nr:HNH endonuclease [Halococcus salsus]
MSNKNDESCFICGEENSIVLQRHHIIPRRYEGSDHSENLVTLCANCHVALERIYTDKVLTQLGRAWEEQQSNRDVSDILDILQSSTVPDPSRGEDTKSVREPFSFGAALAAAYHAVGKNFLKEVLVDLWDETRRGAEEGDPPNVRIEVQQDNSGTLFTRFQ